MRLHEAMAGFHYIENADMVDARQRRAPRSKRRRIRRKWAKRRENWDFRPAEGVIYAQEQKIVIGHPVTIRALKAKVAASLARHEAEGYSGEPAGREG